MSVLTAYARNSYLVAEWISFVGTIRLDCTCN